MLRIATAAVLLSLAAPAAAQTSDTPPPSEGARYTFEKVQDGYLRFDSETGTVSFCSQRNVGWACQVAPEDRAGLEQEIARLQVIEGEQKAEIAALKSEIQELNQARSEPPRPPADVPTGSVSVPQAEPVNPPPATAPPVADAGKSAPAFAMPSKEDLEYARDVTKAYVADTWRKLVDLISAFQKDMMRKG